MTMSAAIGSAEEAVHQGVFKLAGGPDRGSVSGMIALSYGITYIWGTVGIILICKYLPRWWGIDARAAAKEVRGRVRRPNVDDAGLTGYRPSALRAYRLDNPQPRQDDRGSFRRASRSTRSSTWCAATENSARPTRVVLQKGDIVALGGRLEA